MKTIHLYRLDDTIIVSEIPDSTLTPASITDIPIIEDTIIVVAEGKYRAINGEWQKIVTLDEYINSVSKKETKKTNKRNDTVDKKEAIAKVQEYLDQQEYRTVTIDIDTLQEIIGGNVAIGATTRKDYFTLNGWRTVRTGKQIVFERL